MHLTHSRVRSAAADYAATEGAHLEVRRMPCPWTGQLAHGTTAMAHTRRMRGASFGR